MTKTICLTDLQLVLLSNAAARDSGSVLPLPESCAQDRTRIGKAVASLMRRGLVEKLPVTDRSLAWREEGANLIGLFITAAGRAAIGAGVEEREEPAPAQARDGTPVAAAPSPRTSKIGSVVALLEREEGATLDEMVEATGWLPHTTRAALTGLRKKGRTLHKAKRGDATCYRIAAEG